MRVATFSGGASKVSPAFSMSQKDILKKMAEAREQEIRESENKRIEVLTKRINDISDSDMNSELKESKIDMISAQIEKIYESRAEREQLKIEREMEETKKEQEEKIREQEKAAKKMKIAPENTEDALVREDIEGMVKLAVSADGINKLQQTKALRKAEADRLENDIENDHGLKQIGLETTVKTKIAGEFPNHFRERNLAKLSEGISKLEAEINNRIGEANKITNEWAESKEEITRTENYGRDDKENTEAADGTEPRALTSGEVDERLGELAMEEELRRMREEAHNRQAEGM